MQDLIDCPACEGRGVYCLRADDPVWAELTTMELPCYYCNGRRHVPPEDAAEYDPHNASPFFPYGDL